MHRKRRVAALATLALLCLVAGVVLASVGVVLAGGGVRIGSWLIGGGGSTRTSAGEVSVGSALGQAIAGRGSSGAVDLQSGFWSGPRARSTQVYRIYVPVTLADY